MSKGAQLVVGAALALSGVILLGGCGGGNDSGEEQGSSANADGSAGGDAMQQAADAADRAEAANGAGGSSNADSQSSQASAASSNAVDDTGATGNTHDGAMRLFIAGMARGDFAQVLDVVHPDSAGYEDIIKRADGVEQLRQRAADGEIAPAMANIGLVAFTGAFQDATYEEVSVTPPTATYHIMFQEAEEPVEVMLIDVEGKWLVQATQEALPLGASKVQGMLQGMRRPAGPPAPQSAPGGDN